MSMSVSVCIFASVSLCACMFVCASDLFVKFLPYFSLLKTICSILENVTRNLSSKEYCTSFVKFGKSILLSNLTSMFDRLVRRLHYIGLQKFE